MKFILKTLLFVSPTFLLCAGILAQTEPQKSPLLGSTPPIPGTKEAQKSGAQTQPPPISQSADQSSATKPAIDKNPRALDPSNMDTSVKPQDDFFMYANGGWIQRTPIPPEYSRWGSFNELIERNNEALREVAEKAMNTKANPKTAPEVQKVGDYYASGMDEKTINANGAKPLQEEIAKINSIKNPSGVLHEVARLHTMGVGALFLFGSSPDDKNSRMVISNAVQGGLGLPDRDYYTKTDDASKKLRDQYVQHVAKMLTLIGDASDKAADEANKIMALETALAQASRTRVELRDPQKNYNKMSQADLQALTPDWKWADYFKEINLATPGDVNVHQPDFFKAVNDLVKNTPIDDWKMYLRWHLVNAAAAELSDDIVNENFQFNDATLRGVKQLKPRWKRVVASADSAIGQALGKLYVADYFPPEAKARALELVNNLKAALADRIKTLEWMDEPTKQEALKKLSAMAVKIGYPDKWRDYSSLKIDRGPYIMNALRAANFESKRDLRKIGKPVDRTEWLLTPPTVNAYYQPTLNEIVFPAGILQPPFFNAKADDAVNYGGIGAVIGHEMTHGFDDRGRQYDASGNLRDWWSKQSADAYNARRKTVVDQYTSYEPMPGMHVNGELTQGENIADIGGVKIAYAALQKALAGKSQDKIDGLTPDQRFFLSYATIWKSKQTPEDLKLRLTTDPHSPAQYRANGPLSNLPEFQKAFELPDDSTMVRAADKRVNIW